MVYLPTNLYTLKNNQMKVNIAYIEILWVFFAESTDIEGLN